MNRPITFDRRVTDKRARDPRALVSKMVVAPGWFGRVIAWLLADF